MKASIIKFLPCLLLTLWLQNASSQSSSISHAGLAGQWCGWNAGTNFSLDIEHRGNGVNQPINFLTNSIQRMTITNGTGPTAGFVGIGNNFSTPTELLHIHDGSNSYLHVTNSTTGPGVANGVKFGLLAGSPFAIIAQMENSRLQFATNGATNAQTRMTIDNIGRVAIGTNFLTPTFQLDVFGNDINIANALNLSNDIYRYTLVVDGKIIDTRKMIKQQ